MPETPVDRQSMTTRTADISKLQPAIDVCFGLQLGRRHHHGAGEPRTTPARRTASSLLRRGSPTSLKVTFAHMRRMRGKDLADVLKEDWRISQHMMAGTEFFEGVRALLIERDNDAEVAAGDAVGGFGSDC